MRKLVVLGAAAVLVAGVGLVLKGGADERLLGTWEIDGDAMQRTPAFQQASEHEQEMALQVLRAMKFQIVFTEDKVRLGGPLAGAAAGKAEVPYRIVESDEASITIEVEQNGQWKRKVFRFEGEGRMSVAENGGSLQLKKVR